VTIQSRIPAEEYFAMPALSMSRLKEMRRSARHYRHFLDHPKESAPMRLGTAAHCATLEPERFASDFAVWDRRTESGRMAPRTGAAWNSFQMSCGGRTIITADEAAEAAAISEAVRGDPVALKYIETGDPEVTLQWTLGERRCKGRVDWLTTRDGEPCIVGLKTARDCRLFPFASAAAKLGYHLQWAWYFDGYMSITGRKPWMFEIVVESTPPHAVVVYDIPADVIDQGREEYMELLRLLDDCEARDEWPGPATCEQLFSLPSWVYASEDDLSELEIEQ
jgi:hypothetical protein